MPLHKLSKPIISDKKALTDPRYTILSTLIDSFNKAEEGSSEQLMFLEQIDMYSRAIVEQCEAEFFEERPEAAALGATSIIISAVYDWRNENRLFTDTRTELIKKALRQTETLGRTLELSCNLTQAANYKKCLKKTLEQVTELQKDFEEASHLEEALKQLDTLQEMLGQESDIDSQESLTQAQEELQETLKQIRDPDKTIFQQAKSLDDSLNQKSPLRKQLQQAKKLETTLRRQANNLEEALKKKTHIFQETLKRATNLEKEIREQTTGPEESLRCVDGLEQTLQQTGQLTEALQQRLKLQETLKRNSLEGALQLANDLEKTLQKSSPGAEALRQIKSLEKELKEANGLEKALEQTRILKSRLEQDLEIEKTFQKTNSLHGELQHFGIHRDASIFLRSGEYSAAYASLLKAKNEQKESIDEEVTQEDLDSETSVLRFYELMNQRYLILSNMLKQKCKLESEKEKTSSDLSKAEEDLDELQGRLHKTHTNMFHLIQSSSAVQALLAEHRHMLPFCLAKAEARLENREDKTFTMDKEFAKEEEKRLGRKVNNDNFLFKLKAHNSDIMLVIRKEDRDDLEHEQRLQSNPIARFFIPDYVTFMERDEKGGYKPVSISRYATGGDLEHIADKLEIEDIVRQAQLYFAQISRFCQELIALGLYHPDIKLSNFLVDFQLTETDHGTITTYKIQVSDRKTLLSKRKIPITEVRTSPLYSPPELTQHLNKAGNNFGARLRRLHLQKKQKPPEIDLVPYMSFQVGIALKLFLVMGKASINIQRVNFFDFIPNPSVEERNLLTLSQALTRNNPNQRISLETFSNMLSSEKLHLNPEEFCVELNKLHGQEVFPVATALRGLIQKGEEDINITELKDALAGYKDNLSLLDYDAELMLLTLFKQKKVSSISFREVAIKIETIQKIANQVQMTNKKELQKKYLETLYQAIEEGKRFLEPNKNVKETSFANQLLSKTLLEVEKDYGDYLNRMRMKSLSPKLENKTLTLEELTEIFTYLNKYLSTNITDLEFKKDFDCFKTQAHKYIEDEVATYNYHKAWFWEKFFVWLGWAKTVPNRLEANMKDMESSPELQHSHKLLSALEKNKVKDLFLDDSPLQTSMVTFYAPKEENELATKEEEKNPDSHKKMQTALGKSVKPTSDLARRPVNTSKIDNNETKPEHTPPQEDTDPRTATTEIHKAYDTTQIYI
ncbi:protein kinase domain containing protein [Legionella lansingensis]|uniref:Protein kinase domain containing protein n=1 Tax=Legionella lansingensis TaxID=45067 RepID=A0A0W0W1C7_9GAMM|nr:hypothetical protein [Legionella lansingensis]KTD25718.1 protein kinase domain containing protein [Legionella lansingensis]SNV49247.1 protein kinase domain containing protein [Legionella lansingensis]